MIRTFGRHYGPVHYSYTHLYGDVTDIMRSMRVTATQAALLIWEWSHRDYDKDAQDARQWHFMLEEAHAMNAAYDAWRLARR